MAQEQGLRTILQTGWCEWHTEGGNRDLPNEKAGEHGSAPARMEMVDTEKSADSGLGISQRIGKWKWHLENGNLSLGPPITLPFLEA